MLAILVLLIIALAGTVRAQTQAQIQSCGNSIVLATYQDVVTYSTGDTGAFFNATYTYSPTYCNGIPITRITLSNLVSGGTFTCTAPTTFGTSGSLYTQCTESLGAMATAAQAGDTDWSILLRGGVRPTWFQPENEFSVAAAPEPSGAVHRRRRAARALEKLPLKCEKGWTYCPITAETFGCVNTASNLNSCGACPSDPNAKDCSAIDGADRVSCQNSRCIVDSCLRGWQVAPDRASCRKHAVKRSAKMSKALL